MKTSTSYRISIFVNGMRRFHTFTKSMDVAEDFIAKTLARLNGEAGRVVIAERVGEDHAAEIRALGRGMNANPALYMMMTSRDLEDKQERLVSSEAF